MGIHCKSMGKVLRRASVALCCLLSSQLVSASGWTSTASWASVWSIFTVDFGSFARTYIYLDPAASSDVNSCSTTSDSTWLGVTANVYVMSHASPSTFSDAQKTLLANLYAASTAGKRVRLYIGGTSGTCSDATNTGYNLVVGVATEY